MFVTLAIVQLSEVVGLPKAGIWLVHSTEVEAGQTIVGTCVSFTITVCAQVAVVPLENAAVQVTIVVPNEKLEGALLIGEPTKVPQPLALAVALPNDTLPDGVTQLEEAFTVTLDGQARLADVPVTVTV